MCNLWGNSFGSHKVFVILQTKKQKCYMDFQHKNKYGEIAALIHKRKFRRAISMIHKERLQCDIAAIMNYYSRELSDDSIYAI